MAHLIRDALLKSEKGRAKIVEIKANAAEIEARFQQMRTLARATVPSEPYNYNRDKFLKLIREGGEAYEKAIEVLKFAKVSPRFRYQAEQMFPNPPDFSKRAKVKRIKAHA